MSQVDRGASREDWFHFDFVLGLGENLLPCVPAGADVKVAEGSALQGKVGKIPSAFNTQGEAHGLKDWQKRPILSNEIELWSADRRLNICVRTGAISGVYAFDIDIDSDQAGAVRHTIESVVAFPAARTRSNSQKILLAFRMEEVGKCPKRRIKLDDKPAGPAIELLADGQQFVASGSHSSGSRYQWTPSLPQELPTLTLDQLNQLWTRLTSEFAPTTSTPTSPSSVLTTSPNDGSESPQTSSILTEISELDWQNLISALRSLIPHAESNDVWSSIGYALLSLKNKPARQLWIDFSKKAPGYTEGAPESWWDAHERSETRTDYRHIFTLARSQGWGSASDPSVFPVVNKRAADVAGVSSDGGGAERGLSDGSDGLDVVPPPLPDKPLVRVTANGRHGEILDQIEGILKPEVFTQGSNLTRVSQAHEDTAIERSSDAVMLVNVTSAWARKRFSEIATFQRYTGPKNGWQNIDPPLEHVNALCDLGSWTKLRPLDAIARAPFVRADGSICEQAGYDPVSRVLFIPGVQYPDIPADPSYRDAQAALGRIRGVFDQFPWAEPASESAFLAHLLSEAARIAIDRCPMFWYSAPAAGTGKSTLQGMASRIVHGNVPANRPWVSDGDEIRKSLYASLLAGDRSLLFDNVPEGSRIRSPELCGFLTSEVWKDRKLGASETIGVANRSVLAASGNNINPTGDLSRRSLVIRLDANMEVLKNRVFRITDIEGYVMAHRAELLMDALTIIKAYTTLQDKPKAPVTLPSFERWSVFVRDPLIWLGMADPVVSQNETDDESGSVSSVFAKLIEMYATTNAFTAIDIARAAGGISDQDGDLLQLLLSAGCQEPNNPTKVGYWLRGARDRVFGGYKLVNKGHGMRGAKWCFVRIGGEQLT